MPVKAGTTQSLYAVLGSLELLRKRVPPEDRFLRLVDNALEGARRGKGLTERMLAFARKQDLKPVVVDVPDLVRGMAALLKFDPSIRVETRFPIELAKVKVDANQLELAVLNLAVNARDALIPGGGTISIAAREEQAVDGLPAGRYVALSVSDTGIGMDADTLRHAQEPFFTTKGVGKGTGLGLSMVKGLAEQSGGQLRLKSREGEGTRDAGGVGDVPAHLGVEPVGPALLRPAPRVADAGSVPRGEAHAGIKAPGLERGGGRIRQRGCCGIGRCRTVEFRKQQARPVHVVAGDVGMDIDRARHYDLAGRVVDLVGTGTARRRPHDPAVTHPHVADRIAAIGGIDDAAAFDAGQQGNALSLASANAIWPIACATEIALLLCFAEVHASVAVGTNRSTAS